MNVEIHEQEDMNTDFENLESINNSALIRIIVWTLRELITWSTNKNVTEEVRGFCAMLLEAVRWQISKEVNKNEQKK